MYFILEAEDTNPRETSKGKNNKNSNKSLYCLAKRIGRGQPRRAEKIWGNKYVPIAEQCKTFLNLCPHSYPCYQSLGCKPRLQSLPLNNEAPMRVHFICPLDWAIWCSKIWSNSIMNVSCLWENFWMTYIYELIGCGKADCPSQSGWASSSQFKAWTEQKGWPSCE